MNLFGYKTEEQKKQERTKNSLIIIAIVIIAIGVFIGGYVLPPILFGIYIFGFIYYLRKKRGARAVIWPLDLLKNIIDKFVED